MRSSYKRPFINLLAVLQMGSLADSSASCLFPVNLCNILHTAPEVMIFNNIALSIDPFCYSIHVRVNADQYSPA